ncbi:MAG: 16S rRNA (adenine(1518)-N(6)/adenine(1519)-N(6))-dimethyltransferase RsmA [Gammaproteobacteria bacterium]|nr:16S rRNA (adenine(1518)-N(6)/adenine(1519)-N(6))-dimethyltransferase RsmA [Gammaproteobacteria bacterium]
MSRHLPKKRFGQNFLSNEIIIHQIINVIHPGPQDHLIEIGPGLGAITLPLLPCVAKLDAIELDRDIIPLLSSKTMTLGNIEIHQQDALKLELQQFTSKAASLRIVGNLPYNISTPLLFHLFEQKQWIMDMHFMLQKEVGLRLSAHPGSKQYGRLSVMAQYHCQIEALLEVPPHAFTPAPKVDSLFIRLQPIQPSLLAHNIVKLDEVVKTAFSQRRKTLHNALKKIISREQLISLDIDPNKRAEELTVDNFVKISNIF